jgi:CRISPR-associated protein Csy1
LLRGFYQSYFIKSIAKDSFMNQEDKTRMPRSEMFRTPISTFIIQRRDDKLKGADDPEIAAKYEYATWLADAARRAGQIQAVTHVLKATHPDARGSSLHRAPSTLRPHAEIGTHSLGDNYADDIAGNAAALDVYKFLKIEVDGRRLLDWLQVDDADLLAALSDDQATAQTWVKAFKGLIRQDGEALASHEMAKQVYWCIGDNPSDGATFHLLQPLFSSSLTHAIHLDIDEARFGEANKEARLARRENQSHDGEYRAYLNLVERKLGGTKPQNISQLNSERGGVNYLLASLPPTWEQGLTKNLLSIETALDRFMYYEGVSSQFKALVKLLKSDPDPTMETRIKRERIEQDLGASLAAFGLAAQQMFPPGWTRDDDCLLPNCEMLWLDPGRSELPPRSTPKHEAEDKTFIHDLTWLDWPDQVATRFARRINQSLKDQGLLVGDDELKHWAKQAIVEVTDWSASMQRRLFVETGTEEKAHG